MHLQLATRREAVGGSRYRVLGCLGSGGMADVDLALQTGVAGSTRLCVLKRVRKDLAQRADFMGMFFEEARISASLNHPNVVQIYEVGGDERDCFLAMEFLRGRSYAHVQRSAGSSLEDYRVALEVLIATLNGLEHAHQRRDLSGQPMQLVHRDVSPPNVLVTYEGEIKILDFGVAKSKDSLVRTQEGILKGKVAYMAPELVAGEPLDARADLYAVGVMLWEATAGRDRWPNMTEMAILAQLVRSGPVESPGSAARGLPPLADDICQRALARYPQHRHQSAAELRADIARLAELLGGRLGQEDIKRYMAARFAADRRREDLEIERALGAKREATEEAGGANTRRVPRRSGAPAPLASPGAPVGPELAAGPAFAASPALAAAGLTPAADVASRELPALAQTPSAGTTARGKRAGVAALALGVLGATLILAKALMPAPALSADPNASRQSPTPASGREAAAPTATSPTLPAATERHSAASADSGQERSGDALGHPSPPPSDKASRKPAAATTAKVPPKPGSKQLQLDRQDPWQ